MKLPALWLAAALAAGIALAEAAPAGPRGLAAAAGVLLAAGVFFVARNRLTTAWVLALAGWAALGAFGARMEPVAVPAHHATRMLAEAGGPLELSDPLRWTGRLKSDPVRLPNGVRYEIALEAVELAGESVPITGGLRAGYYPEGGAAAALPAVRAGDRVEVVVRARVPRGFANPGSFDFRAHLARQGVHLTAALRHPSLLRKIEAPPLALAHRAARIRGAMLDRVDQMFAAAPERAAVLRAMLLGDRSFIDYRTADVFQRTAAYHVLVVSGLHVAALAVVLWWLGGVLRLGTVATTLLVLVVLGAFVAVVEDRPPIERAALMATVYLVSKLLFRNVDLLNSIGVAAAILLVARPSSLADPSFQLSFAAAGMIGALGLPWVDQTSGRYRRALEHLNDPTRDVGLAPRATQLRLDLRAAGDWLAARLPRLVAERTHAFVALPFRAGFRVWDLMVITFAIQLGMLPLMAHYFNRVNLAGPLVNIPAATLAGLIVPLGLLAAGLGLVWSALATQLAPVVGALAGALVGAVEWFGRWGGVSYRVPNPPAWLLVAFAAAAVALAAAARWKAQRPVEHGARTPPWQAVAAGVVAVLAVLIAWHPFPPRLDAGKLEITVLDVGQGDAIFAAFPDGRTLLVDGGGIFGARAPVHRTAPDVGEVVVSRYLWHRGLKRLDAVALSHAHLDHMDGLHAVFENFEVGEFWVGREARTAPFAELAARAAARGARLRQFKRGDWFDWGGAGVLVLWPETTAPAETASNDDSLVLRLEFGAHSFLLTGEIERAVEQEMVVRDDPLAADFLKVSHHGSRTSNSSAFVAAVSPRIAAISLSGTNPFGHPHREVLDALARPGLALFRTDRDGAVTVTSDGRILRATGFLNQPQ